MTTLALPRSDFALLDRLILEAFWDLRSARAQAARARATAGTWTASRGPRST